MLYGHGDNGYTYSCDVLADFSSNVWHGGEPSGLKEHIFRQWHRVRNYPEVVSESLSAKVAVHHSLPKDQLLITAGATESIHLLAQLYRGSRSSIVIPSFSEYEDACMIHDHRLDFLHWERLDMNSAPLLANADLLWIGSPNNPTGSVYPISKLTELLTANPRTLVVVDEAFIEFSGLPHSAIPEIRQFPNLIVLRSLTKAFAIPGLRLGYIAASKEIIDRLQTIKMPWSVNAFAWEAGHYIFDHYSDHQLPLTQLLKDKNDFVRELRSQSPGLMITDSQTHFFLCKLSTGSAAALQKWLLNRHGLLIRDASNFRGLGPVHFRLATLRPEQNRSLINALKEFPLWQHR